MQGLLGWLVPLDAAHHMQYNLVPTFCVCFHEIIPQPHSVATLDPITRYRSLYVRYLLNLQQQRSGAVYYPSLIHKPLIV